MIISDSHKFIFFHVPKNAGTSLCNKLAPVSRSCEIYPGYKEKIDDILELKNTDPGRELVKEVAEKIPKKHLNIYFKEHWEEINWMNLPHLLCDIHSILKIHDIWRPRSHIKKNWDKYKKYHRFAIIRNSWDYAFSIFKNKVVIDEVAQTWSEGYSWDYMVKNRITRESFLNFIHNLETDFPRIFNDFFFNMEFSVKLNQQAYITSPDNFCYANHIIRFEKINEGLEIVSDKIGIDLVRAPKLNVSIASIKEKNPLEYVDYYDDEAIKKVENYFREDINKFGYKFGEI